MIKAVIENKGDTLVTEFPKDYLSIYEELCSIGCRKALERIPLTDNEEDDIRVKLYSDSNFGIHLLCLFSEENTLADANTVCNVIEDSDDAIKEELEQNLLHDQYGDIEELMSEIKELQEMRLGGM